MLFSQHLTEILSFIFTASYCVGNYMNDPITVHVQNTEYMMFFYRFKIDIAVHNVLNFAFLILLNVMLYYYIILLNEPYMSNNSCVKFYENKVFLIAMIMTLNFQSLISSYKAYSIEIRVKMVLFIQMYILLLCFILLVSVFRSHNFKTFFYVFMIFVYIFTIISIVF